ncbi:MAG: beta-Ala-His dipeptidase [Firmicutes bacterium]|nr:beta-Ala-His dipeptidase [Candidatus Colimorpha enterica]
MEYCELEPKKVFEYFALLCSVPHGSGNTDKIADLCVAFAKERSLKYVRDGLNNVIIFKDGTKGREDHEPVIIQGHLDMVCAKAEGSDADMANDGITLVVDGDRLRADGTSMGGDNCLGVAMALALLDSSDIPHPPLECVFTTDEETGMFGAAGLDVSPLKGRRMLNVDSEGDTFTVGCAGGLRINCTADVTPTDAEGKRKRITVNGLKGGHSGAEINCGRASANKLLARILHLLTHRYGDDIAVAELHGGQFDNVITPFAYAEIILPEWEEDTLTEHVNEIGDMLKAECAATDPNVTLSLTEGTSVSPALDCDGVLDLLYSLPQGVQGMSFTMPGLVETSCNLGVVSLTADGFRCSLSVRSSVASKKEELAGVIETLMASFGCDFTESGDYPGWEYSPVSPLRDVIT